VADAFLGNFDAHGNGTQAEAQSGRIFPFSDKHLTFFATRLLLSFDNVFLRIRRPWTRPDIVVLKGVGRIKAPRRPPRGSKAENSLDFQQSHASQIGD
jgi:hypothetical protein